MKPLVHATNSVRKYGGVVEDYLPIHNFFDHSKSCVADIRHRAVMHNAFGIYVVEQVFGVYVTNAEGKKVSVRQLGEDHVIEDLGFIPSLEHWLRNIPIADWMHGAARGKKNKVISFDDFID